MKTIQIKVPDSLDVKESEFLMILASKLYEDGKLSSGQAAELAGLTKRTFLELLNKFGVSVIHENYTDLQAELANA